MREGIGCIPHRRMDIVACELRIRLQKIRFRGAFAQLAQQQLDRDSRAANDRFAEHPRDVFSRDLYLLRGPERELVHDRDREYTLCGSVLHRQTSTGRPLAGLAIRRTPLSR
jgi:hypothetical protein